jgi:hypothetical protein
MLARLRERVGSFTDAVPYFQKTSGGGTVNVVRKRVECGKRGVGAVRMGVPGGPRLLLANASMGYPLLDREGV